MLILYQKYPSFSCCTAPNFSETDYITVKPEKATDGERQGGLSNDGQTAAAGKKADRETDGREKKRSCHLSDIRNRKPKREKEKGLKMVTYEIYLFWANECRSSL